MSEVVFAYFKLRQVNNPKNLQELAELLRAQLEAYFRDRPFMVKTLFPRLRDKSQDSLPKEHFQKILQDLSLEADKLQSSSQRAKLMELPAEFDVLNPQSEISLAEIYCFIVTTQKQFSSWAGEKTSPLRLVYYSNVETLATQQKMVLNTEELVNHFVIEPTGLEGKTRYEDALRFPPHIAQILSEAHQRGDVITDYFATPLNGVSLEDLMNEANLQVLTEKIMTWLVALPIDDESWRRLHHFFLLPLKSSDTPRVIDEQNPMRDAIDRVYFFQTTMNEKLILPLLEGRAIDTQFRQQFIALMNQLPKNESLQLVQTLNINLLEAEKLYRYLYPDQQDRPGLYASIDQKFPLEPNPFRTTDWRLNTAFRSLNISQRLFAQFPELQKDASFLAFIQLLHELLQDFVAENTAKVDKMFAQNLGGNYYEWLVKYEEQIDLITRQVSADFAVIDYWPYSEPFDIYFATASFEAELGFSHIRFALREPDQPIFFEIFANTGTFSVVGTIELDQGQMIEADIDFSRDPSHHVAYITLLRSIILANLQDRLVKAEAALDEAEGKPPRPNTELEEVDADQVQSPKKKKKSLRQLPLSGHRRFISQEEEGAHIDKPQRTMQIPHGVAMHPRGLSGSDDVRQAYQEYMQTGGFESGERLKRAIQNMYKISQIKIEKYPERLKVERFANPFYIPLEERGEGKKLPIENTLPFIYLNTWVVKHRNPNRPMIEVYHTAYRASGRITEIFQFTKPWIINEDNWGGDEESSQ